MTKSLRVICLWTDQYLLPELIKKGVNVKGKPPEQESLLDAHFY